ncbi:hypothetical protein TNCV_5039301 [Trichonephila clavipes]|nr:hypothetical protein TNCV_5039301 [Trichonephila clavipes]
MRVNNSAPSYVENNINIKTTYGFRPDRPRGIFTSDSYAPPTQTTWSMWLTIPIFFDEAHFWLNGYVNKQNCRNWSEANPQVSVETPLHPEKLTVWCALWAGGILLQKR